MSEKKYEAPGVTAMIPQIKRFDIPPEELARVGREVKAIAEARRRARQISPELFTMPIGPGYK